MVVELDGNSHENEKAKEIDKFKDEVYGNAGIKIARIRRSDKYNPEELAEQIKEAYSTEYKVIYHEHGHKNNKETGDFFNWLIDKIITVIKTIFK